MSFLGNKIRSLPWTWYWREGAQTGKLPTRALTVPDFPNISFLRHRWEEENRRLLDFVQGLSAAALKGSVTYNWLWARPRTRPLWHILQHIVNHATHHRSEIGNHLAVLGQSPKGLDFMKFVARDAGR